MHISTSVFLSVSLLTATALASPAPNPNDGLETRAVQACTIPVVGIDKKGTCVDTSQPNTCAEGLLVRGYCNGPNTLICCIPNDCFTKGDLFGARD